MVRRRTCGRAATLLRESMLGAAAGAKPSTHTRAAKASRSCEHRGARCSESHANRIAGIEETGCLARARGQAGAASCSHLHESQRSSLLGDLVWGNDGVITGERNWRSYACIRSALSCGEAARAPCWREVRCTERAAAPRLMRRAAHRWRLIEDAPFTLALAALLLPVAAPQAVEEGFPQQQPHHTAGSHTHAHTHTPADNTHTHTHARPHTRTAVGESESDHGSRGSGRLRTNSSSNFMR